MKLNCTSNLFYHRMTFEIEMLATLKQLNKLHIQKLISLKKITTFSFQLLKFPFLKLKISDVRFMFKLFTAGLLDL